MDDASFNTVLGKTIPVITRQLAKASVDMGAMHAT